MWKKAFYTIIILEIILAMVFVGFSVFNKKGEGMITPVVLDDGKKQEIMLDQIVPTTTVTPPKTQSLPERIGNILAKYKGHISIVIKDLKSGQVYKQDEERIYASASLYKLWVMVTVYDEIEKGNLTENAPLRQSVAVLNRKFNIASEEAELTVGVVSDTVAHALERMIAVSDNYSALLLSEKVGLAKVSRFLKEHGFISSLGEPPKTTAADTANFLEKLYKGELGSQDNTEKMLDFLKKQELNKKLPLYLPEDTVIAHKTGELGKVSHDAGIVYSPKETYIIVILTETNKPSEANEIIAEISRVTYDYFN